MRVKKILIMLARNVLALFAYHFHVPGTEFHSRHQNCGQMMPTTEVLEAFHSFDHHLTIAKV